MNPNSVNPLAEGETQVSAAEDVTLGLKNPENSDANNHAKTRGDKGRTHLTHCGLLSQDIVRAVVRSGESLRTIRKQEKKFRAFFKPRGTLGNYIFDCWWASILRRHLSAKLEAKLLTPDEPRRRQNTQPVLREGHFPILVSGPDLNEFEIAPELGSELSEDLFRGLALAQRYDAHHSREANQMAALLLLMRKGGEAALVKLIGEGFKFSRIQKVGK